MDNTRKYVTLNCEICNEEYIQQERVFKKSKWKNRCPNHRRTIVNCSVCGKEITLGHLKCKTCSNMDRKKERPYCVDCGKEIKLGSTRCLPCHNINQDTGKSKERVKFQNSKQWKEIRAKCFERDNSTCQMCGSSNTTIECHHIKQWSEYPEERLSLSNLITLCFDCHKRVHFEKQILL